jgi:hypothetical protein
MSVILGFNAFHADSAARLAVDGKIVGAAADPPELLDVGLHHR